MHDVICDNLYLGPRGGKDILYREESIHQAIFIIINVPLSKHFWRRAVGALR